MPGDLEPTAAAPARRIHDVTLGMREGMLVWPDDPPVVIVPWTLTSRGDPANVSELRLGSHTGTHVDPPAHFADHAVTVDDLDLHVLVGPATVVDLSGLRGSIEVADLDALSLPETVERLIFKTDNSAFWAGNPTSFPDSYVSLSPAGARWLVERGARLVAIDFLSIEPPCEDGFPVHQALLGAGVILVEGLDLSAVAAGDYLFVCLPLKLVGGDGAPARCVLIEPELAAAKRGE